MTVSRLSDMTAHEVSLVKRGAIKKPFLVLKNEQGADGATKTPSQLFALTDEQEAQFEQFLQHRLQAVRKDGETAVLSDRAQAALRAVYRILLPFKDEISEDDIDELIGDIGVNSESEDEPDEDTEDEEEAYADDPERVQQSAEPPPPSEGDSEMGDKEKQFEKAADDFKKPDGVDDDQHASAMKAAQDAYKKAVGKSKTDKGADDEEKEDMAKKVKKSDDSDTLLQSLPAEAQAYFRMVQKRADMANEMLVRKSETLAAKVAAMEEEKELQGYAAQLGEFRNLTLDVPKQSRLLKSLKAADAEAYDSYIEQLRTSNEQVRVSKSFNNNLYGSMGSATHAGAPGHTGHAVSGDANQQLEALVQNYVAKSGEPMPEHERWKAVLSTPEGIRLYEQAGQERKAQ